MFGSAKSIGSLSSKNIGENNSLNFDDFASKISG